MSLVVTYAVTQTVPIRGTMTAKKYNQSAPHQEIYEKNKITNMSQLICTTVIKTFPRALLNISIT